MSVVTENFTPVFGIRGDCVTMDTTKGTTITMGLQATKDVIQNLVEMVALIEARQSIRNRTTPPAPENSK